MVTRGPGATHASTGVHTAMQDSTPLVLLVGPGAARASRARGASRRSTTSRCSAAWPSGCSRSTGPSAFPSSSRAPSRRPSAGRPGPGRARAARGRAGGDDRRAPTRRPCRVRRRGAGAGRPSRACASCWPRPSARSRSSAAAAGRRRAPTTRRVPAASGIPAAASFRCQDVVDNRLPVYCGDLGLGVNPALARRVREADLVLAIGTRLSETETGGYTYLTPPVPSQTLVHVHQDADRARARLPPGARHRLGRCPSSPPRRARSSRSTAAATPTGARPRAPTTRTR